MGSNTFIKKENLQLIFAIVVGVVIIAATGYGVWKMNKDIDNSIVNVEQNGNDVQDINTSDWKTYRNEEFGFEVKYPAYLKLIDYKESKVISITNVLDAYLQGVAYFDGEIWINISNVKNDGIDVFNKIGQVEKSYSYQVGNTTDRYYNFEFLNFDAVMWDRESSGGEIELNPGVSKTLYFQNTSTNTVNKISADIPNKNKKQIELFNEILKTIKLID